MSLAKYNKTIAAIVTSTIGWAASVVVSDRTTISAGEWIQLATAVATTFGVYQVTNQK